MTTSLAAQRNRSAQLVPARAFRRPDRVFLPGIARNRQTRQHPVKTAQHRRNYKACLEAEAVRPTPRQHSYHPDDLVYLTDRPAPRKRIEGINVPHPTEDWQSLNEWRARFGLKPIEPW